MLKNSNTFKVREWNGITDYNELPIEEKQKIWGNFISGSQMKNIIKQPKTTWLLNKKHIAKIPPGEDPRSFMANNFKYKKIIPGGKASKIILEQSINDRTKEKLIAGNDLEDAILKMSGKQFNQDIKFDKRTFESTLYPFMSANIDGYVGKDVFNMEILVENKNSVSQDTQYVPNPNKTNEFLEVKYDINILFERYKYQIYFYMWFFNTVEGILNVLYDGFHVKQQKIYRTLVIETQIEEMLNLSVIYNNAKVDGKYDLLNWTSLDGEIKDKNSFNVINMWMDAEKSLKTFEERKEFRNKWCHPKAGAPKEIVTLCETVL